MARPRNTEATKTISPALPAEAYERLVELVEKGYGTSPADVGRFLILREIDDLKRAGVLRVTGA